jgi:hypothetical protein
MITYPPMKSWRQTKRLVVLLIIIAYVITPLVDSIACDGCSKTRQIRESGVEGICGLALPSPSPSIGLDQENDQPPATDEVAFCAVCANSLGALSRHGDNLTAPSIFFEGKPTTITLSEAPASIYRPPRNI